MAADLPRASGLSSPTLSGETQAQRVVQLGGAGLRPFPPLMTSPRPFPPALGSVVDSLVNYLTAWEALPASRWALGAIRSGFRLLWGPRRLSLCFLLPFSPSRLGRAGSSVTGGSRGSGQERCSRSGDLPFSGVFGHLVCVPKVQKASSREAVRPGDWGASLDLTDAYFQIPFAKADRKWLRFVWEDQKFQFRALPFGLSLAPWYSP